MTGFKGHIQIKIPPGRRVQGIDDALKPIGFLVHLSEPADAENPGKLTVLLS